MTTFRTLAAAFLLLGGLAAAQSQPQDLPWAAAEFSGGGDWAVRLPQLLVRGWEFLPDHRVTEDEKAALARSFLELTLAALDKEESRLKLELDRKRLAGGLPATEPAATVKALAEVAAKRLQAIAGLPGAVPPAQLPFKPLWAAGRESLPWGNGSRPDLLSRTKALYLVTGSVRTVGTYLAAEAELYSAVEKKVLARWAGQFAPDEAPEKMAEAADEFRTSLLGRPWAGLDLTSAVPGTQVFLQGKWRSLPWNADDFVPGRLDIPVRRPGRPETVKTVELPAGVRTSKHWEDDSPSVDTLVLDTLPSGIPLYLDSRYLGLSPQTVDRPLTTTRVRADSPDWAETAWEIGPRTASPSLVPLRKLLPLPSVPRAKDRFYLALASFSFSLTSSAFLGAWQEEQVKLTNAYASAGAPTGYGLARERYQLLTAGYGASVVLTSGVFVWMMFELGDYLGAAQASLP